MAEVKRIIRISEEIRMNMEIVQEDQNNNAICNTAEKKPEYTKLSTNEVAKKLNRDAKDLLTQLITLGYVEQKGQNYFLTIKGKNDLGGEARKMYGKYYFLWNDNIFTVIK